MPITGVHNGAVAGQTVESGDDLPTPTEFPDTPMQAGARSGVPLADEQAARNSANAIFNGAGIR